MLCIGSECPDDLGDAPEEEFYGLDDEGDGPMDGPIEFRAHGDQPRGLVLSGNTCIGTNC